jgi:hypothetical protein
MSVVVVILNGVLEIHYRCVQRRNQIRYINKLRRYRWLLEQC